MYAVDAGHSLKKIEECSANIYFGWLRAIAFKMSINAIWSQSNMLVDFVYKYLHKKWF